MKDEKSGTAFFPDRRQVVIGTIASAAALSVNPRAFAADEGLRIGMVAPISGPLAKFGQETVIGSQIAADVINELGGVGGKKISIVVADTPTPDLAKSAVERLVTGEKLKVIVGNYGSSLAIASSTTATRYGAFYWEQSSSSYDITRKAANSVKTTWGNYELIRSLNDVLKNVVGPKIGKPVDQIKVVLMHEDSGWGSELAQLVKDPAVAGDLKVALLQAYNAARTSDFTPMILRMKEETPDVLVAASYQTDAIKFQQQAREQDFNVKAMIGFTAGYGIGDFPAALGKASDDILVIDSNPEINPKSMTPEAQRLTRDFIDRFQKQTGRAPASHALYAFLGSYALLRYVLPNTPSMEAADILKTALALDIAYGNLPMSFGLHFTSNEAERPRYNERGLTILNQWRDGRLVAVYPAEYATAKIRSLPMPPWAKR